jgi:hypothetical protein
MEVVQPLTEARGVTWPARAIVLRLAVVLTDWMYTPTVVEVPLQLLQRQVRLRRPVVILCLDGLSWDAIRIMYQDVHCQTRKLFREVTQMKVARAPVLQLAIEVEGETAMDLSLCTAILEIALNPCFVACLATRPR